MAGGSGGGFAGANLRTLRGVKLSKYFVFMRVVKEQIMTYIKIIMDHSFEMFFANVTQTDFVTGACGHR